jgi:hypothetical protein
MTPLAVLMAKEATDAGVPASQGNVLAPMGRSWQNNSYAYYTRGESQGYGTPILYAVHSYQNGKPAWRQPPQRLRGPGFSAALYPVADSLTPPPIDTFA